MNNSSISESCDILASQDFNEDLSIGEDGLLSEQNNPSSFTDLSSVINSASSNVELTTDYAFDNETDGNYIDGIIIKKNNFVINGNNHIIDAKNNARLFTIIGTNVTLNNIVFKNSNSWALNITNGNLIATNNVTFMGCGDENKEGGAVYLSKSTYSSSNDKFIDNYAKYGSAIYSSSSNITITNDLFKNDKSIYWALVYGFDSNVDVIDTTFANLSSQYATAIYIWYGATNIKNSRFNNLFANVTAGAVGLKIGSAEIDGCEFLNVSSSKNGGAVFLDLDIYEGQAIVNNTKFENCSSQFGGAFLQLSGDCLIANSTFKNNFADYDGGAFYISTATDLQIINCTFVDNNVNLTHEDYPTYGGAVFIDNSMANVMDSKFINNHAINASALYLYDCEYKLSNLEFNGNGNPIYTFFDGECEINNLFGNDLISDDDFNNTFYPYVICGSGKQLILVNTTFNFTELPSKFNLADYNLVTPVKDQGSMGSCWAFAIVSALESALLKSTNCTYDLSENNLQNSMIIYSKYGNTQSSETAAATLAYGYLLNWLGVLPEEYDEYDELGKISPVIKSENNIHVQDIVLIPYTAGTTESIENIKQAILDYGALMGIVAFGSTAYDEGPETYNEETFSLYDPEYQSPNHAICVVGWDDNFSKDNFLTKPEGDGAWIIKNSWGTEWGDNGYFYISYYDQTLCPYDNVGASGAFIGVKIENTVPYTRNYQYDFIGLYDYVDSPGLNIQVNTYVACEDEVIAAVGTYFDPDINYTIEIMINDSLVYRQQGISQYFGYCTVKLDQYVSIKKGEKFSVAIVTDDVSTLSTMGRVKYPSGVSIDYSNYVNDLSAVGNALCVKAYTLPESFIVDKVVEYYSESKPLKVHVNQSNVNVTISLENITITNVTDENGVATFELPMMDHGTHPISVYYNDSVIVSTVTVLSTIDVPDEIKLGCNANANTTITFYQVGGSPLNSITLPLPNEIGTYTLSFINYVTGEERNITITVVSRFIRNDDLTVYYGEAYPFVVRVVGDDGDPVGADEIITFEMNGLTAIAETDNNGVAGIAMPLELLPGTYIITATYKGQTIKNTVIIKEPLSYKKTVTVKITDKKLVLQVALKYSESPMDNEKITFKFMGKTYTAKTDKNGIAKVIIKKNVIKKLKAGKKYTINIVYFNDVHKATVKVKQPLSSKKIVTVKKTAKKLVLKAKLKYGKSPLKHKKITFKFNGKKYTAKTNKNGIAKVTIKKNVIKKLKAGKKYTVKIAYLTDVIKTTVKVRK